MLSLTELQKQMQAYILQGDDKILKAWAPKQRQTLQKALTIYADGYLARLVEHMERDYPQMDALLGDETFAEILFDYCEAYPSKAIGLQFFGRPLSTFLRERASYAHAPFLADLAAWERMLVEATLAPDATYVDKMQLAQLNEAEWNALTLQLHPSLQTLCLQTNLAALTECEARALADRSEWPRITADLCSTDPSYAFVAWRKDLDLYRTHYDIDAYALLQKFKSGMNFAECCVHLQADITWALQQIFSWFDAGWIQSYSCIEREF
jgi:hypothetical protein